MGMEIQLIAFNIKGVKVDVSCFDVNDVMLKNVVSINLDIVKTKAATDLGQINCWNGQKHVLKGLLRVE